MAERFVTPFSAAGPAEKTLCSRPCDGSVNLPTYRVVLGSQGASRWQRALMPILLPSLPLPPSFPPSLPPFIPFLPRIIRQNIACERVLVPIFLPSLPPSLLPPSHHPPQAHLPTTRPVIRQSTVGQDTSSSCHTCRQQTVKDHRRRSTASAQCR